MDSFRVAAANVAGTQGIDAAGREMYTLQVNPAAGGATAANQATEIASLASIDGKLPTPGAKAGAGSISVVPNSDTAFPVAGDIASGAADSGKPVKVGGVAGNAPPAGAANGQRINLWLGSPGNAIMGGLGINMADAQTFTTTVVPDAGGTTRPLWGVNSYYNGATLDVVRGNTNGAFCQGNVASGVADAGNGVKQAGVYTSTLPTVTTGQRVDSQYSARGSAVVQFGGAHATGADGNVNTSMLYGLTSAHGAALALIAPTKFNGTSWDRNRKSNSTGRLLAAANTTNATSLKASAGDLFKIQCKAAAAVFLKIYNKASAPTVGTDTPVLTLALAVGQNTFDFPGGHYFGTGIAYALTGLAADADTTAVAVNDVTCLNFTYA